MEIKAVKFYENGFMTQPFACGLEDGAEKLFSSIPARPKIFPIKSLTKKL